MFIVNIYFLYHGALANTAVSKIVNEYVFQDTINVDGHIDNYGV